MERGQVFHVPAPLSRGPRNGGQVFHVPARRRETCFPGARPHEGVSVLCQRSPVDSRLPRRLPSKHRSGARIEVENGIYHVVARGNERKAIYRDAATGSASSSCSACSPSATAGWLSYCLMGNHYHLLVADAEAEPARGDAAAERRLRPVVQPPPSAASAISSRVATAPASFRQTSICSPPSATSSGTLSAQACAGPDRLALVEPPRRRSERGRPDSSPRRGSSLPRREAGHLHGRATSRC